MMKLFAWWTQSQLLDRVVLFFFLIVSSLFVLESVSYMGMIESKVGFPVWGIAVMFFALGVVWRGWRRSLPNTFSNALLVLGTAVVWAGLFLRLLDRLVYANFTYSTFHLQSMAVVTLGVWLGLVSFICWSKPQSWRSSLWFASLPAWLTAVVIAFGMLYPIPYYELSKEDSLVEYLTALAYLLAGLCALLSAGKLWRKRTTQPSWRLVLLGLFLIAFLGFTVVAGEEISWGQRILGFETPEEIAQKNTQGEFNLHNHDLIFGYVYRAYGVLATSAIIASIVRSYWRKISTAFPDTWQDFGKDLLKQFAPQAVLIGWFIPMLVFVILRENISHAYLNPWEEVMEGFLATGIFLTLAEKVGFNWLSRK